VSGAPSFDEAHPAADGTFEPALTDCRQNGADLRVWGTVRNLGAAATAYRVQVTATDPAGAPLLTGYADTEVVAPGETGAWLFRTSWPDDLPSLGAGCTVSGVEVLTPRP
jgi:hypothetical protein